MLQGQRKPLGTLVMLDINILDKDSKTVYTYMYIPDMSCSSKALKSKWKLLNWLGKFECKYPVVYNCYYKRGCTRSSMV